LLLFISTDMVAHDILLLDSSIRDWVVLPLLLMVVLVGMGRHYVSQLIKSDVKVAEKDLNELRYKQTIMMAQRLRGRSGFINSSAFNKRKLYLTKKGTGVLRQKGLPGAANPMSNPMAMMDMLKGNMTFMIPNFAMMAFVNFFFSGFVCLKVPFPMPSTRFKLMLQRGVDLTSLDVSYVSSLCLYFLLNFGLNGFYKLILGENDLDNMMGQMGVSEGHLRATVAIYSCLILFFVAFVGHGWDGWHGRSGPDGIRCGRCL
jgi:ER membrane protein complex subunit 3